MPNLGPCQFIQDQIDSLEQQISDLQDALNEVPPRLRPAILAQIARLRNQIRAANTELQSCLRNPRPFALSLDGIEATQAIQDMSQSVPLVATKSTVVRVYLSYSLTPAVTVRGQLSLKRSPTGPSVVIPSVNTVVLDPAQIGQLDAKRRNAQLSLNFAIPADQTGDGPLYVSLAAVTDAGTGTAFDIAHLGATLTITFSASPPLRIRLLGIRYQYGTPPVTYIPSALDFGLINSWLTRAYPVSQVISSRAIVDSTATPPFSCGQINAQVAAIRALDMSEGADKRTHYYGLVSDGGFFMRGCSAVPSTPDPSAVGSGPTGPATWGWDFDGSYGDWYTGHELGHTFGRLHPGACGESHDDPSYPFMSGQLANADDAFVGFDVGDAVYNLPMVALPGTAWHDVMTYCSTQWLSSYTYEGIRARLLAENSIGPGPTPSLNRELRLGCCAGRPDERFPDKIAAERMAAANRNLISVVANVNLTKETGKIEYVNPLPQAAPSTRAPSSQVILRVKGGPHGGVLQEVPVDVKPITCDGAGQDRLGLVDAVLAVEPDARVIELLVAGHVVDTFQAGPKPPNIRALTKRSTEEGGLSFAWQTDSQAGDKHTYTVQASTDNGQTWQTLAVGLPRPEVSIDRTQFQGAKQVLVRVIATDGFTRSIVTSEPIRIE